MKKDKMWHFLAGAACCLVAAYISSLIIKNAFVCGAIGFTAGAAAGVAKDFIYDKMLKQGVFEWLDIIVTFAGSMIAAAGMTALFALQ